MLKLLSSNRYPLPGTDEKYWHIATVVDNLNEYICFMNRETNQVFIEEITASQLEYIDNDELVTEIKALLDKYSLLTVWNEKH